MSKSTRHSPRVSNRDLARLFAHVVPTAACDIWLGAVGSDGYGKFSVHNDVDGTRIVSPHHVAAARRFGPVPLGATLMHDCDVRVCVSTDPGHVRVATQRENMRQAARRGRLAGPRPGLVDVRGKVGASRAVQAAIGAAVAGGAGPQELAAVLAVVLAAGDPLRDLVCLFDPPPWRGDVAVAAFPVDLFDAAAQAVAVPVSRRIDSLPLFDLD